MNGDRLCKSLVSDYLKIKRLTGSDDVVVRLMVGVNYLALANVTYNAGVLSGVSKSIAVASSPTFSLGKPIKVDHAPKVELTTINPAHITQYSFEISKDVYDKFTNKTVLDDDEIMVTEND